MVCSPHKEGNFMQTTLWQQGCQVSHICGRTTRHPLHAAYIAGLSVIVMILSMLSPGLAYANAKIATGTAPNGPGASSNWSPSTNTVLGTAANTTSDVWFTSYNGIITEVYYPTADEANST